VEILLNCEIGMGKMLMFSILDCELQIWSTDFCTVDLTSYVFLGNLC